MINRRISLRKPNASSVLHALRAYVFIPGSCRVEPSLIGGWHRSTCRYSKLRRDFSKLTTLKLTIAKGCKNRTKPWRWIVTFRYFPVTPSCLNKRSTFQAKSNIFVFSRWTGASLDWRLMRQNIIKDIYFVWKLPRMSLLCKLVPV